MAIDSEAIKAILVAGTYPEDTLNEFNIFGYEQYVHRRLYPSCEIIQQRESTDENQKQTTTTYSFDIRLYIKNLGERDDETSVLDSLETEIMTLIEAAVLQDNKIVLESKVWNTQQVQADGTHPAYLIAVLKVIVRQIGKSTAVVDGMLTFVKIGSDVVNPPSGDYEYIEVFDTEIDDGYRTIQEIINTKLPVPYSGAFSGSFITNVWIQAEDIGATSDKLNQMTALKTNGEKQEIKFKYTDKYTNESPGTITESFKVIIDSVHRIYRTADATVFRLTGKIMEPSVIS